MITHYDLFAGIGGFSLALDNIFYDKEITHIFCEWEAFPTAVLKKHWPDATYFGDIADLVAHTSNLNDRGNPRELSQTNEQQAEERQEERIAKSSSTNITLLTGGFPCQPFSHAGRRNGTADDRYKWPEMFAVIKNVRPDWVIAENVRGLVTWNDGLVLETVCADLESEGYEVQPLIIPAVAVGAPHRRDRVWIVGHTKNKRRESEKRGVCERENTDNSGSIETSPNPRQQLRSEGSSEGMEADTTIGTTCTKANQREHQYTWSDDWREVAFATCYDGVDDGLSRQMGGVTISGAKHRKEALKAYGNAIVPQVAMEIFKAIISVEGKKI